MRKVFLNIIILLSFLGIIFSQQMNPCEDKRYLTIKEKSLDEMSDREYAYFTKMDEECQSFQKDNSNGNGNIQKEFPKTVITKSSNNNFELSDTKLKEYKNQKLSIEIVNLAIGSNAISEISKNWTAYKGFDKISEEEFVLLHMESILSVKLTKYMTMHSKMIYLI